MQKASLWSIAVSPEIGMQGEGRAGGWWCRCPGTLVTLGFVKQSGGAPLQCPRVTLMAGLDPVPPFACSCLGGSVDTGLGQRADSHLFSVLVTGRETGHSEQCVGRQLAGATHTLQAQETCGGTRRGTSLLLF